MDKTTPHDPRVPMPTYPNLWYLLERALHELHEANLGRSASQEATETLERLQLAGSEFGDREISTATFWQLLELLATAIRRFRIDLQHERAEREQAFTRWSQRIRAGGNTR